MLLLISLAVCIGLTGCLHFIESVPPRLPVQQKRSSFLRLVAIAELAAAATILLGAAVVGVLR